MTYSPNVKEEPVAQGTTTVKPVLKPGPIQLSHEERQALQLSECSEDKCEQARIDFIRETLAQGKDGFATALPCQCYACSV